MVVSAASSIGARVTGGGRAVTRHFLSPFFLPVTSPLASHLFVPCFVSSRFILPRFTSPHLTSLYHISPGVTAVRPIFLRHKSHLVSLRPTLSSLSFSFSLFLFSIQTRQRDVVTRRFAASHMNLTQIENATYIQNNLFFFFYIYTIYHIDIFGLTILPNFFYKLINVTFIFYFNFQFLFIATAVKVNCQTRSLGKNMYIYFTYFS